MYWILVNLTLFKLVVQGFWKWVVLFNSLYIDTIDYVTGIGNSIQRARPMCVTGCYAHTHIVFLAAVFAVLRQKLCVTNTLSSCLQLASGIVPQRRLCPADLIGVSRSGCDS